MGRILRRPAAKVDLIAIYRYIAEDSAERAAGYLRAIDDTLHRLSDAPLIGTRRLASHPDVRMFPCRRHVILYRPLPELDGIEVIRIYHAAQDWLSLIEDDLP